MRILFISNICKKERHCIPKGYQEAAIQWQEKLLDGFVPHLRKQAMLVLLVSITELVIFYLPLSGS